jgi:type I restriction enzyme R subunit
MSDELNKVELPAITQLQSLGWDYIDGTLLSPDVSEHRKSFKDVVLESRLKNAILRLNPWISEENLAKVMRDIIKIQSPNLIEANQHVWSALTNYISVDQDLGNGRKGQTVKIIDFEAPLENDFLCVNQFKIAGVHQNIIPDIILFVNGLPLAVIECKSPYTTSPMEAGIDQLLRYANRRNPLDDEGAEKLFHYNQIMISTHRDKAKVGTISSRMEHYLDWKDPYPLKAEDFAPEATSQEILIAGLLNKLNFLDIIQNFTVFEPVDGRIIKKIARYQQFRAVGKTIDRLRNGKTRKDKSGVIWHTQGSGKSLTMVFLTVKLRRDPILREYKLVFLTDRTQLDNQLTTTFKNTQDETVYHADSVKKLKELLSMDSSDIVTAMVQKFQENADDFNFPVLNTSDKIIVLADEAHRTQYGSLGAAINTALPNAPKIAFTGTPLIKSQKTNNEFGSYIDTYTIEQAVRDGATVQILYEGREAQVKVTGDSLDSLFKKYFGDRTPEEQAEIKRKFGKEKAVLEAPQRIRRVCIDLLEHYREHIQPNGFKAMIVTSSRNAAILYKDMLDELQAPESAVIISGDHNDEKRYWGYTDGKRHKTQIEDFKRPLGNGDGESNLSILIVKDMLLTGFDAPVAQVMYLDRKLTDHSLLQAIARVNRTSKNKFCGYIVDYYGLSDYLTEALEMFSTEDVAGVFKNLKDEIPRLKNAHTRVLGYFKGINLDDFDECILSLKDEVRRQQFHADFQKFCKFMDIILPDSAAIPFLGDLKKLGKISIGARNMFRDTQLDVSSAGEKVRKLIEEHVYSTGVDPKIPPMDLLAKDFKEKLNQHKSPRAKASEIENAIKDHIKVHLETDPEYYAPLSVRLKDIIEKNKEKWEELVQLLLDFRDKIEVQKIEKAKDLGLSENEYAFYGILMAEVTKNEGVEILDEEIHAKIISMVKSLVSMMNQATSIVEFFDKWNEVKRVKRDIRRAILEESFGTPELSDAITERFMELARVKFK